MGAPAPLPHPQSDLRFTDLPLVVEVNPMEVLPADGQRLVTPESVADLLESLKTGQLIPAILFRDAEGNLRAADGNRRALACCINKQNLKAIILDHEPTKVELRRIRVAVNNKHKPLSRDELAAEIYGHIQDTSDSQAEAGAYFDLEPPQVSKILAPFKSLLEEFHHLRGHPLISWDALRVLATTKPDEIQRRLGQKVQAAIDAGKRVKRDTLEHWKREMLQATNGAHKKPREVKAVLRKVKIAFTGDSAWQDAKDFAKRLLAACTQGEKAGRPFTALPELLTG